MNFSLLERSWRSVAVAIMLSLFAVAVTGDLALAQEEVVEAATDTVAADTAAADADLGVGYALDNVMLFIAAVLVFFMQAGFAMVEAGFNSSKNAVNILFKNSMDICVGVLLFFILGFGIMYPTLYTNPEGWDGVSGYFAFGGTGLDEYEAVSDRTFSPEIDWLFQAVFAATAATIVSGAVAGRMKVAGYLVYSAILTGLIYPISGYWKWGGGWLTWFGEKTAARWHFRTLLVQQWFTGWVVLQRLLVQSCLAHVSVGLLMAKVCPCPAIACRSLL